MNEIELLKEKVLRLEQQMRLISRSNQGLSIDPALNTLGQDTEIKGNLDVAGNLDITGSYLVNGSPVTADDPDAVHLDGSRIMTGNLLNSATQIIVGYGSNGETAVQGGSNGAIEIGKAGRSVAGTPYIDFHSSENSPDYDARIIASGGSSAGAGQGTLNFLASSLLLNNSSLTTVLLQLVYPVGSIYLSVVSTNPATLFGFGTWVAWGTGRVPVGINTGDGDFNTVEKTGGSKYHQLSINELPSHTHTQNEHDHYLQKLTNTGSGAIWAGTPTMSAGFSNNGTRDGSIMLGRSTGTTATNQNTGGNLGHNNIQPYITCYMWKRTA